jgi:hypothetical protein
MVAPRRRPHREEHRGEPCGLRKHGAAAILERTQRRQLPHHQFWYTTWTYVRYAAPGQSADNRSAGEGVLVPHRCERSGCRPHRFGRSRIESAPPAARTVEPGPFMARTPARPVGANFGSRLRAASIASTSRSRVAQIDDAHVTGHRPLARANEARALVEGERRPVRRARRHDHRRALRALDRQRDRRPTEAAPLGRRGPSAARCAGQCPRARARRRPRAASPPPRSPPRRRAAAPRSRSAAAARPCPAAAPRRGRPRAAARGSRRPRRRGPPYARFDLRG